MLKKSKIKKSFIERFSEIKGIKAIDIPKKVVLVNKPFYDDLINWLTIKKTKSPKNLNTELFYSGDKIKDNLKRGVDYEIIGSNLWNDITKKFGSVQKIEAILVKNPKNGEDTVLITNLNCIQFNIYLPKKDKSNNSYSINKMPIEYYSHSDWILEDIKHKICQIYSIDQNSFSFTQHKASNLNDFIDEKIKMSQVLNTYKNELDLRRNKLNQSQGKSSQNPPSLRAIPTSKPPETHPTDIKMASPIKLEQENKIIVCGYSSDPSTSDTSFSTENSIEYQPKQSDLSNTSKLIEEEKSLLPMPVGLNNLGNTCYFNAAVQCLARIMPLTNFILSDSFKNQLNRFNVKSSQGTIARSYRNFLEDLCRGPPNSSHDPSGLRRAIMASYQQFANNDQHDSQELLCSLLDGLHEDMNQSHKAGGRLQPVHMKSHSDGWEVHLSRNSSPIVDIFHGVLYSNIKCPLCKHLEKVHDPFVFLSIEIPRELESVKLETCLAKFSQIETLDSKNKWRCEKCKKKVCATKEIGVEKCGKDALIIHLKRFSGDGSHTSKIETVVEYPDILKATTFAKDDKGIFKLVGAVFHFGDLCSGHYTAAAIDPRSNKWYGFDDSTARKIEKRSAHNKGAYILFYQRQK